MSATIDKIGNIELTVENGFHKGKYGYHPCDHATYLRLKRLNFLRCVHERVRASLIRWLKKDPKNRRKLIDKEQRKLSKKNRQYKPWFEPKPFSIAAADESVIFFAFANSRLPLSGEYITENKEHVLKTYSKVRIACEMLLGSDIEKKFEDWFFELRKTGFKV